MEDVILERIFFIPERCTQASAWIVREEDIARALNHDRGDVGLGMRGDRIARRKGAILPFRREEGERPENQEWDDLHV